MLGWIIMVAGILVIAASIFIIWKQGSRLGVTAASEPLELKYQALGIAMFGTLMVGGLMVLDGIFRIFGKSIW